MNLLEKFDRLNNRLTSLLEENKELKQHYKNLQEQHQELKEKLDESDYNSLQEENKELKEKLEERDKQYQQHFINLEKQKNEQLELNLQCKNLQETNKDLKQRILNQEKQETNLLEENERLKRQCKNLQGENKNLKQKLNEKLEENERIKRQYDIDNIRVVVGLDFGATYSGFSYCHTTEPKNINTNSQWPDIMGFLKTNTVLQYDDSYNTVKSWGYSALAKRPPKRGKKNESETRPVELFKLHLTCNKKPYLPGELRYEKAITDYLRKIGQVIKDNIKKFWPGIDFFQQVLLVLTVPAEYSDKQIAIMRDCVFNAELINVRCSKNLRFTTEPEAVAIYCLEDDILTIGSNFMVVDCGGGTVDLTTRKLLENNKLGEITERAGDFCGSTYIDQEFINFLRKKLGSNAVDLFIENNYGQYQYMIQDFCRNVKLNFTGESSEYRPYELEIEETAPVLLQYVNEETKYIMEENEWIIEIKYEDVKAMYDPVVDRIINLIRSQLDSIRNIQGEFSAIFLAGGFSESRYLQKRIKKEFRDVVKNICVPRCPIAAISRGAVMYGLSSNVISTRILKYTYG
ncbi:actin-like ATPase domain-containing protein, partial [Rhizophagus irregularis]